MSVPSSVAAPACAPRQQHKKSAAERRQQSRRAEGRVVQRLLVAFDSIRRHRGNTQGRLAQALSFALSAAMRQGSRAFGPALNQVEPRADAPVFSPAPAAAAAVHPPPYCCSSGCVHPCTVNNRGFTTRCTCASFSSCSTRQFGWCHSSHKELGGCTPQWEAGFSG